MMYKQAKWQFPAQIKKRKFYCKASVTDIKSCVIKINVTEQRQNKRIKIGNGTMLNLIKPNKLCKILEQV